MPLSAIFLTIIIPSIFASTSGFTIEPLKTEGYSTFRTSSISPQSKFTPRATPIPASDFKSQPIAGYPKVPPPNAYESGGNEDDLLPPFEDSASSLTNSRSQFYRRSIQDVKVDPKTGYPLVAEPSWKFAGGNEENLELPLEEVKSETPVDPKTGYPLFAKPEWKNAGGDGDIIALPLEETEATFGKKEEEVDPKTGYPLKANPSWKDAGGDGDILELPVEELSVRSDKEAVDPKTGYPLVAQDSWKYAGGDGDILQVPLEETFGLEETNKEAVDPKTGYPLVAQDSWKNAGGDGDILELPLEETEQVAVDPKTGYPLIAQPGWKNAGGDENILQLPLPPADQEAVDPKTGYPLTAKPSWKDAGGNGDILELPIQQTDEVAVDPKTGYPLIAQPGWKDAGGDDSILQPPVQPSEKEAVDPKTGYPLVAQPDWKYAGGDENILELPLDQITPSQIQSRSGKNQFQVIEIIKLTELQPPPAEKNFPQVSTNSFSTPSPFTKKQSSLGEIGSQNQKRNSFPSTFDFSDRPVESSYTYTGPENVLVTVTRFSSANRQEKSNHQRNNQQNGFVSNPGLTGLNFQSSSGPTQLTQTNPQRIHRHFQAFNTQT